MAEDRAALRRILAYVAGHPLPLLERLPIQIADTPHRMSVAFVRMAGESSPWAIGWRIGDGAPRILSVPEPRNRDLVAAMVAEFGDALTEHLSIGDEGEEEAEVEGPARQIWIGGSTDLEMLHFIALRFARARKADDALLARLNRCGRICQALFEWAKNPNRSTCVVAGDLLRSILVFPTEPVRTMHLGYMLAMIAPGTLADRLQRAAAAEAQAVSTSIAPDLERNMEPLVGQWHTGSVAERKSASERLHSILVSEITRRLDLLQSAIATLQGLGLVTSPAAAEIATRSCDAMREFRRYDASVAAGAPTRSPETDHDPLHAAREFAERDADELEATADRLHHDGMAQSDAVQSGDAIRGRVTKRESIAIPPRTRRVRITLLTDGSGPLSLRAGDRTRCPLDTNAALRWVIQSIEMTADGRRTVVLQASQAVGMEAEPRLGSKDVVFYEASEPALRRRLAAKVWDLEHRLEMDDLPSAKLVSRLKSHTDPQDPAQTDAFPTATAESAQQMGLEDA